MEQQVTYRFSHTSRGNLSRPSMEQMEFSGKLRTVSLVRVSSPEILIRQLWPAESYKQIIIVSKQAFSAICDSQLSSSTIYRCDIFHHRW